MQTQATMKAVVEDGQMFEDADGNEILVTWGHTAAGLEPGSVVTLYLEREGSPWTIPGLATCEKPGTGASAASEQEGMGSSGSGAQPVPGEDVLEP